MRATFYDKRLSPYSRMLDTFYPFSFITYAVVAFIGVGIGSLLIGGLAFAIIWIMIWMDMIRITPLIDFLQRLHMSIFPNHIDLLKKNIKKSFKIRGDLKPGKYIYMWHPHGLFAYSQFLHIGTDLTDWPEHLKGVRGTAFSGLYWLPFGNEISDRLRGVPSEYGPMKNVLDQGKSLSLTPGGMREMCHKDLTAILSKRRGIFKMALETGTPLVPILSKGENELFSCIDLPQKLQDLVEPYDFCISIPTLKTVGKWFGLMRYPLKDPVISVLGQPLPVKRIENPTKKDIDELREKYIASLKELCKREGVEIKII